MNEDDFEIDYNYGNPNMDYGIINIEEGTKMINELSEIVEKNGKKYRVVYLDKNNIVVSKDESVKSIKLAINE